MWDKEELGKDVESSSAPESDFIDASAETSLPKCCIHLQWQEIIREST